MSGAVQIATPDGRRFKLVQQTMAEYQQGLGNPDSMAPTCNGCALYRNPTGYCMTHGIRECIKLLPKPYIFKEIPQ